MQFEMNKFLKFGYLKLFLVLILFEQFGLLYEPDV